MFEEVGRLNLELCFSRKKERLNVQVELNNLVNRCAVQMQIGTVSANTSYYVLV